MAELAEKFTAKEAERRLAPLRQRVEEISDQLTQAQAALDDAVKVCLDDGLPVVDVARAAGLSRPTIYKIKSGAARPASA